MDLEKLFDQMRELDKQSKEMMELQKNNKVIVENNGLKLSINGNYEIKTLFIDDNLLQDKQALIQILTDNFNEAVAQINKEKGSVSNIMGDMFNI